jgi:hypothetical protein
MAREEGCMAERQNSPSGAPEDHLATDSQAVNVGNALHLAGTIGLQRKIVCDSPGKLP